MEKVLLHICCAPCATYPVEELRSDGYEVMGYFYNPNIHPYSEFAKRKEWLEQYSKKIDLKVIFDENYNPVDYFKNISYREIRRCFICYQMRLEQAAHIAKKGKFDYFTTTLLVSKYQKHEVIREVGELIAQRYSIKFLYKDFREGFSETVKISKEMGMYRQQYCGCLYSEIERFAPKEIKNKIFS
ncbi:Epoxyqueuosine reductase [Candidatus Syntrophocurvum alkaliphilum]|uniref:Epoxyqueuosine reductase QueH n=1 Tax=Candidatus Syntrophocurvum alkaliphilum TaxID=2293317 RepID=A0A6I6DI40_9FIRM|nr:epoxyqueuosine reductase QueH [Candidatus Syntrophocurvum alkaliphilum]QGT99913.1 Epoxyqueuosine reductase [Candidatus Syntrophocurvum alkaliphilum]